MPINPQGLLSQQRPTINPFAGLADSIADAEALRAKMEQQRAQLEMQKQQFAEQTRQAKEDQRLRALEESGRMARATLEDKRAAEQARQQQLAGRRKWANDFATLNSTGDTEGARAMLPEGNSLGVDVELQDEVNGLPRYRIDIDPETTAAKATPDNSVWGQARAAAQPKDEMAGIGYPGAELNDEALKAEPLSTEDAFSRAQSSQASYAATGEAKPADTPDFMGGVPQDVIDVPAMQASIRNRLDPALAGLVNAYPVPMGADGRPDNSIRESAEQTANAVREMNLSGPESVKMFASQRNGPDSMMNAMTMAQQKQAQKNQIGTMDTESIQDKGFANADKLASDRKMTDVIARQNDLAVLIGTDEDPKSGMLTDGDPNNDKLFGPQLARQFGDAGAIALADVANALGTTSQSLWEQIKTKTWGVFYSGLKDNQKQAIVSALRQRRKIDEQATFSYLDNIEGLASDPSAHPERAVGMRRYVSGLVPQNLRDRWKTGRDGKKQGAPRPATGSRAEKAAAAAANAGDAGTLGSAPLPSTLDGKPKPKSAADQELLDSLE